MQSTRVAYTSFFGMQWSVYLIPRQQPHVPQICSSKCSISKQASHRRHTDGFTCSRQGQAITVDSRADSISFERVLTAVQGSTKPISDTMQECTNCAASQQEALPRTPIAADMLTCQLCRHPTGIYCCRLFNLIETSSPVLLPLCQCCAMQMASRASCACDIPDA